jgi:hypothetical protein
MRIVLVVVLLALLVLVVLWAANRVRWLIRNY